MRQDKQRDAKALEFTAAVASATNRRTFLRWAGVTVGVSVVAACAGDGAGTGPVGAANNHEGQPGSGAGTAADPVKLGTGDILVLNFAYALEQLEAAFYTQVVAGSYFASAPAGERQVLEDLRKHEVIHREFLKEALGASAIRMLEFDFSSVNFGSRQSVLTTARIFEDLGVSAYNGAGKYLENLNYLLVAGKIVSVEARHAAAIRDLLQPKSTYFAGDDVVNAQGLDVVNPPRTVFMAADPFITTVIDGSNLPTS